jgi:hypothetical protein
VPDAATPVSRTRSAPAAFGRGVSQVVANPGLLLAPLAFGGAVAAAFVAAGACVVLLAGSAFSPRARSGGAGQRRFRISSKVCRRFSSLRQALSCSPF